MGTSYEVQETDLHEAYNQVRRSVSSSMPSRLRRQLDPEDVVQDAYAEAFRNNETDVDETKGVAWLCVAAKRRMIDRFRSATAQKRTVQGGEVTYPENMDIAAAFPIRTPSSFVASNEEKELLKIALAQLSERQRIAIIARFFDDLPFAEVAQQLDVSIEAAQMLVTRAIRRLRALLGNQSKTI